ncbi:hypothetical protein LXA43DRAFT_879425 [Ganoderma leucocontextum]|nr:hypothetical protein LXA43DRAFT_879425 [Ganoderma leucocontextum]
MTRVRLRARCSWTSQAGGRCKTLVTRGNALPFPQGGKLPFYCSTHLDDMRKQSAVQFKSIIPVRLEPRTQVLLGQFMRSSPTAAEEPGYIYALGLVSKLFNFGRTTSIPRRISEHRRRCPSFKPVLLGCYPAPFCHLLERLVHLELTDIATKSYPANRTAPRPRCADCEHVEIFTFRRFPGDDYHRAWHRIIRPIFERWGRFVSQHVV